jgi:hypothetical protein
VVEYNRKLDEFRNRNRKKIIEYNKKKNEDRRDRNINEMMVMIRDGSFTDKAYSIDKIRSYNQLFNLSSLRGLSNKLSPDELNGVYKEYVRMHEKAIGERGENVRASEIEAAYIVIYDHYLVRMLPDDGGKLMSKSDVERFVKRSTTLLKDVSGEEYNNRLDSVYTRYYNKYKEIRDSFKKKKVENVVERVPVNVLEYPWKTKVDKFQKRVDSGKVKFDVNIDLERIRNDVDFKAKPLKKKYSRPSFAIEPYSWEIDLLIGSGKDATYLIAINQNTRYVYAIPVSSKSKEPIRNAIDVLVSSERGVFDHPVRAIRGDGEKGFIPLNRYFPDIKFMFKSSKFTFHNKLVDSVMRTLRNGLGNNSSHLWNGRYDKTIQQLVAYYNHTYHRVIKMAPIDMHVDVDLEWKYIREKIVELNGVRKLQREAGLFGYEVGDRLMLHLDYSKTSDRFAKRRRAFDRTGTFVRYVGGNVVVRLDKCGRVVEVPIFYTKLV